MNTFRSALVSMARDYAEIFRDRNLDDDLLRYLVGTIYGMRGPLYASMAMGILVTAAAWAITKEPVFLPLALVHPILGAARLLELRRFRRDCGPGSSRLAVLEFDHAFSLWSATYAFILGITFYELEALAGAGPRAHAFLLSLERLGWRAVSEHGRGGALAT